MRKGLFSGDGHFSVASGRFVAGSLSLPLSSLLKSRIQVFIHWLALSQHIGGDFTNAGWLVSCRKVEADLDLILDSSG